MPSIEEYKNNWSLFLDRDGVINKRIFGGYVKSPNEFEFLPGSLDAIVHLSKIFNHLFIVSNQQGIGKGLMNETDIAEIHDFMLTEIHRNGGKISAIYYCADLASKIPNCRKPGLSMAYRAKKDFPEIEFSKSIMVGDTMSDMEFGMNAGMKCYLVHDNPVSSNPKSDYKIISSLTHFSKLKTF